MNNNYDFFVTFHFYNLTTLTIFRTYVHHCFQNDNNNLYIDIRTYWATY